MSDLETVTMSMRTYKELTAENEKLKAEIGHLEVDKLAAKFWHEESDIAKKANQQLRTEIEQLRESQAYAERLREALVDIEEYWDGNDGEAANDAAEHNCATAATALSTYPADALKEHDAEVRRKALMEAAKWFNDHVDNRVDTWQAEVLRNMANQRSE